MICNENCDCFTDGERPYCSISGLAVSEGMKCLEDGSADDYDDSDDENE